MQEREDSDRLVRELMHKSKQLQEDKAATDASLKAAEASIEQLQDKLQQAKAAAESGTHLGCYAVKAYTDPWHTL